MAWHHKAHVHDSGTVTAAQNLVDAQQEFADQVTARVNRNEFVIGLGGGHEIGWASYLGLYQARINKCIGIINIDAHFDLRNHLQAKLRDAILAGLATLSAKPAKFPLHVW